MAAAPVVNAVYDGPAAGIDSDWVSATSQLRANWTSSATGTGLTDHEYCISTETNCTGTIFETWTSTGLGTDMTADGQPVSIGSSYYTCVRATDGVGSTSIPVCSDGVEVALPDIPRDGTSGIDAQYQDSKTSLSINWDPLTTDTGSSYDWKLCSEIQCLVPIASGTTSATTITVSGISPTLVSGRYIGCVRTTDPYAYTGEYLCSNGVRVDANAPTMSAPRDGSGTDVDAISIKTGGSVAALTANWDIATDNLGGEGVDHYDWMFCTAISCSGPEIVATSTVGGTTETSVTASISPTQTSGTMYACVRAVDGAGNVSNYQCSDGALIGTTGGTNKSGTITSTNEVWTKAMSPINLTGHFTISTGSTLTIDPGVTIRATGGYQIRTANGGSLHADGSADDPILFTRNADQGSVFGGGSCTSCSSATNWLGFKLDTGSNNIDHAVIRYAGLGSVSLVTVGSSGATTSLSMDSVRITNSPAKLQAQNGAALTITNSFFDALGSLTATDSGTLLTATGLTASNGSIQNILVDSAASADIRDSALTGSPIGLKVAGAAQADLAGTSVTGATGLSSGAVDLSGSGTALDVDDAAITGSVTGVKIASGATVVINNSTVSSNTTGLLADGTFAVVDTTIASNSSHGISYSSTGMGTAMTGVVQNAAITDNGGAGIRGRVTSSGVYTVAGSTISRNAGSGIHLLGNGTSVTGNPSLVIGNRITNNAGTGTNNYGVKIEGTFGVSGDNSKWPAGHRNVVTHNGNSAYNGGGQISSETMYPPTSSWAALPHWADNDWGASERPQPLGTRTTGGSNDTNVPCDNPWFYSSITFSTSIPLITQNYPEVAKSTWGYNRAGGVETYCAQSNAKLPVGDAVRTTLMGSVGSTSDVAKSFRVSTQGVNTATGNYTETRADIANPSDLGPELKVERTYNSTDTGVSVFGRGWSWNLGARIDVSDPTVALTAYLEDGTGIQYYSLGGNAYGGPSGTRSTLEAVGSPVTGYVLTRTDQSTLNFDTSGRLTSNLDRNGDGIRLTYSGASPLPSTAADEAGHTYTFSYDGNDKIDQISSSDGRGVDYSVIGEELRSVADVRGKTWAYAYDNGLVESLTSPEGRELFHNEYGADRDITAQQDAIGKETTLNRNASTDVSTMTDPAGNSTVDTYGDGKLTSSVDPLGNSVSLSYDNRNNPKSITDTNGGVTKLTYDARGNVTKRITPEPFSYVERFTYDADNNITSKTDARGNITHYVYDGAGNLRYEKRQDGPAPGGIDQNVTEYVLNADKQVEEIIDARGKSTYRAYDPITHYLIAESAMLGEPKTYDHDAVGRVTEVVDPVGNASGSTPSDYTTTTTYDAAGNVLSVENAYGHETQRSYDDDGRLEYELDEAGERTDYEYDDAGRVTKVAEPAVGGNPRRFTRKLYDKRGLLVKEVDQLGRITTYTYNSAGQRTSKVLPKGNIGATDPDMYRIRYLYDAAGRLTDTIDPLGNTTSSEYDALGRVTRRSNARFQDTQYRYDANDNVVAIINNAGNVATREYDELNRVVARGDFRGNLTRLEYNAVGLVTKERTPEQIAQSPDGATTYCYDDNERRSAIIGPRAGDIACGTSNDYQVDLAYDEAGRLASATDPEGNVTTTAYDRAGRKASQTDGEGHTTHFRYTDTGRLHEVEAPPHPTLGNRITTYGYNEVGDLVTRTNANGDVTTYGYDAAHQLVGKTMPTGSAWTYGYDLNGNHASTVDANGNATTGTPGDGTTEYAFDRADRIVGIDYSDSTPDVSYDLTPTGQVAQATAGPVTETYGYDGLDRLADVERGSESFAYGHDADGNITSRTYPGQSAFAYAYDGDGRLEQVGSGGGATTYAYDDAGNRTTTSLPNGIVETRTYDHADRLTEIDSMDGATHVENVSYTLDGVGNPLTKTTSFGTETYAYDEMNQLDSVCFAASCSDLEDDQVTFVYDKVGKRLNTVAGDGTTSTTTTYCYAADSDELLGTITTGTCLGLTPDRAYDANGNLTSDSTRDYAYDLENRVTSIDDGTTTTTYGYDADGKRVSSDDGITARDYYWDTTYENAQLAINSDGTTDRSYRYGHGRISTSDGTDEQIFLADRIGSVLHVTDVSADIDWSYEYDPFGNVRSATHVDPLAPGNDMQYAGEQLDPTGLTYLRARQYDPSVGLFASIDPLEIRNELPEEDPVVSAYLYANNKPTSHVDPSGESPWLMPLIFTGVVGVGVVAATVAAILATYETEVCNSTVKVIRDAAQQQRACQGGYSGGGFGSSPPGMGSSGSGGGNGTWGGAGTSSSPRTPTPTPPPITGSWEASGTGAGTDTGTESEDRKNECNRGVCAVIGETMMRVRRAAYRLKAAFYHAPPAPERAYEENNRIWINAQMDRGVRIYDCGLDPMRTTRSDYYAMEIDELNRRAYPRISVVCP